MSILLSAPKSIVIDFLSFQWLYFEFAQVILLPKCTVCDIRMIFDHGHAFGWMRGLRNSIQFFGWTNRLTLNHMICYRYKRSTVAGFPPVKIFFSHFSIIYCRSGHLSPGRWTGVCSNQSTFDRKLFHNSSRFQLTRQTYSIYTHTHKLTHRQSETISFPNQFPH